MQFDIESKKSTRSVSNSTELRYRGLVLNSLKYEISSALRMNQLMRGVLFSNNFASAVAQLPPPMIATRGDCISTQRCKLHRGLKLHKNCRSLLKISSRPVSNNQLLMICSSLKVLIPANLL